MKIKGAVMAGGESRRFGRPKAFATWEDSRFYERAVDALAPICNDVVLSVREDQLNDFPGFSGKLVTDLPPYESCGPLGGLFALMTKTDAEVIITLPCDMPLFEKEDAEKLLNFFSSQKDIQALIPSVNGKLQPLSAVYSGSCLPVIKAQLEEGDFRMRSFFEQVNWLEVPHTGLGISEAAFSNINDQQAYEQVKQYAQRRTTDGTD
ncbi:molybdenum cofactor guanylyltransferase [Jeotgalibacillus haloalkalitolerans]|uniref:Probable molybdenum cofactor guanylyltransferase n=1 Tax=Jeotgalibacillus haloalkalitolerans TaxID=3104292 RepID=A0ABU5KPX4_9BACL|nr:molybdenum cofactor guanylyltransferase [Jeotgalibacillus sp. HH7-29]MDZ5713302.1 molybdenum cofactor guanylyltransferase [Jeotgalibacillus sp. HH7-29]